jgi:hypothetical protein
MDHCCDRCGTRAQVQYAKWGVGTLMLCQHHANMHADELERQGWIISAVIGAGALL